MSSTMHACMNMSDYGLLQHLKGPKVVVNGLTGIKHVLVKHFFILN
jgi:hypothetical protein